MLHDRFNSFIRDAEIERRQSTPCLNQRSIRLGSDRAPFESPDVLIVNRSFEIHG
jgi:hypothetical protein